MVRCCAKALEIVADKITLLLTSRGPVSRVLAQHEGTKAVPKVGSLIVIKWYTCSN